MAHTAKPHSHKIGKIGTALTLICSVHCIATPVLALFLPFLGHHDGEWLELLIIGGVIVLGSSSLIHSYRDHHQNKWPLSLFAAGILILLSGIFLHGSGFEALHTVFMIVGSLIAAAAQILNLRLNSMQTHL